MAAKPITSVAVVEAWAPSKLEANRPDLKRLILAASDWIEGQTDRVIVAPATAAVELYDGNGRDILGKDRTTLFLRSSPVISVTAVTENGVALTTAQGYSTTADVIIDPGDRRRNARLLRRSTFPGTATVPRVGLVPGGWADGIQNIAVTVRGGFDSDSVPEDIQQLCAEVTWALHKLPTRAGRSSQSRQGSSVSFTEDQLSPIGRSILESYKRWR